MSAQTVDLSQVPREKWAGALALTLIARWESHPDILFGVVDQGEAKFVTTATAADNPHGLTKDDFRKIFRKLARKAGEWGHVRG